MNLVMLGAVSEFCTKMAGPLKFVGIVLWIFKIAIPVIIVVMGMIDLGKAVTASKDDEIKKAMKQLMVRLISGVLIFFIPTIVGFAFGLADGFDQEGDYSVCRDCITSSSGC